MRRDRGHGRRWQTQNHELEIRCCGSRRRSGRLHRGGARRATGQVRGGRRGEVLGRRVSQRRLHPLQGAAAQRRARADLHHRGGEVRHRRGRQGDRGLPGGLHPQPGGGRRPGQRRALPDEEEQDSGDRRGRALHRRAHAAGWAARPSPSTTASSRPVRPPNCCRGPHCRQRVVTYEEQILSADLPRSIIIAGAGAIGVEFAYVLRSYGVDVTIVEYLERLVPVEDAEVSAELARRYRKLGINVHTSTRVESIDDTGDLVRVAVVGKDGQTKTLEAEKVSAGHRFRAARDRLRAGEHRGEADRPGRHRRRRPVPHQRAAHLRHRRCHRQAHARARGRGDGHHRRRDHRGRRDDGARLRDDPAGDVLPAADRQLRLDRGAGPGEGLRRTGVEVPVHRQRKGTRPRRHRAVSSKSSSTASTASCWART